MFKQYKPTALYQNRQLLVDFMEARSEAILEGLRDDYLPEEYLEDLVYNDEAVNVYQAYMFLKYFYQDDELVESILEGLYEHIYS